MSDLPAPAPEERDALDSAAGDRGPTPLGRAPDGAPLVPPDNDAMPPAESGEEMALRIARLRAQVASGQYRPDPAEVARAMVDRASD